MKARRVQVELDRRNSGEDATVREYRAVKGHIVHNRRNQARYGGHFGLSDA